MIQEERLRILFPIGSKVINNNRLYTVKGYMKKYKYSVLVVDDGLDETFITERCTKIAKDFPKGLRLYYKGYSAVVQSDDGESVHIVTINGALDVKREEL